MMTMAEEKNEDECMKIAMRVEWLDVDGQTIVVANEVFSCLASTCMYVSM